MMMYDSNTFRFTTFNVNLYIVKRDCQKKSEYGPINFIEKYNVFILF